MPVTDRMDYMDLDCKETLDDIDIVNGSQLIQSEAKAVQVEQETDPEKNVDFPECHETLDSMDGTSFEADREKKMDFLECGETLNSMDSVSPDKPNAEVVPAEQEIDLETNMIDPLECTETIDNLASPHSGHVNANPSNAEGEVIQTEQEKDLETSMMDFLECHETLDYMDNPAHVTVEDDMDLKQKVPTQQCVVKHETPDLLSGVTDCSGTFTVLYENG